MPLLCWHVTPFCIQAISFERGCYHSFDPLNQSVYKPFHLKRNAIPLLTCTLFCVQIISFERVLLRLVWAVTPICVQAMSFEKGCFPFWHITPVCVLHLPPPLLTCYTILCASHFILKKMVPYFWPVTSVCVQAISFERGHHPSVVLFHQSVWIPLLKKGNATLLLACCTHLWRSQCIRKWMPPQCCPVKPICMQVISFRKGRYRSVGLLQQSVYKPLYLKEDAILLLTCYTNLSTSHLIESGLHPYMKPVIPVSVQPTSFDLTALLTCFLYLIEALFSWFGVIF